MEVRRADAMDLIPVYGENAFTEIVTDPPWGLYRPLNDEPSRFCQEMLESLEAVLAPYGRLVVLTALKAELTAAAKRPTWSCWNATTSWSTAKRPPFSSCANKTVEIWRLWRNPKGRSVFPRKNQPALTARAVGHDCNLKRRRPVRVASVF